MSLPSLPEEPLTISAYLLPDHEPMPIVPSSKFRDWMDEIHGHYAYRCLPMLMANQRGWVILNNTRIALHWNGSNKLSGLRIAYLPITAPKAPCFSDRDVGRLLIV
ncbi:MAG: hypothetical protein CUN55_05585 [Phototrophicales bacterium]|nr:MAG: hypothetical protein CUN55_05585 [Phototrophicales bacterium]